MSVLPQEAVEAWAGLDLARHNDVERAAIRLAREVQDSRAKLDAIETLFHDERDGYFGYEDGGYDKQQVYLNLRDDVLAILNRKASHE